MIALVGLFIEELKERWVYENRGKKQESVYPKFEYPGQTKFNDMKGKSLDKPCYWEK